MAKTKLKIEELTPVDYKTGLTSEQVKERTNAGLTNQTSKGSTKTISRIIFDNVVTFFNFITLAIAVLLILVGRIADIFFLVIVTMNTVIGIIQEIKAKKTIDKLSLISAPIGVVFRDGETQNIEISKIVLNDILVLSVGKQIPADGIVVEGFVEVDESLLTGESDLVEKKKGDTLYSGSFIASGTCKAEAIKVGKRSYIETLTNQAKKYKRPKSDLMQSLSIIVKVIGFMIVPIAYLLYTRQISDGILQADAVAKTAGAIIGMIPSGLMLLTSLALAVGVIRLGQNNTLVQELYCIEMLARVDTLCLDKTGTITDGTMKVKSVVSLNSKINIDPKDYIPQVMAAFEDQNQTSEALIEKYGLPHKVLEPVNTIPFSSQRKYLAAQFESAGTIIIGAPEFVLTKSEYKTIETRVNDYAKEGYRVLVYAHSKGDIKDTNLPSAIKAHSLILLEDNVRPDAISTIEYFKVNGVDIKVISGDNAITAAHIANRAGIANADKYISLEGLSDDEVVDSALKYYVFGRVSPEQKRLLIETMKQRGKTVGMVGDGVNDILALREADTSVAMASGSEAARNVSHLVLLDSDFSSMPKVVSEGRRVINNVQRVATLFLTKTIFSLILTIVVLLLRKSYPLEPRQLYLIDFLVIGVPAFFLSLQANNDIVKGSFLANVIKKALPGALAITLQITAIMIIFQDIMNFTPEASTTLIVLSATFTGLVVLFRELKPFNTYRRFLFFFMVLASAAWALFLPGFFGFNSLLPFHLTYPGVEVTRLPFDNALLLVILLMASPYVIDFFSNLPKWTKRATLYILKKLSGV